VDQSIRVTAEGWLVAQTAADVIDGDATVGRPQRLNQVAEVKGPSGVAVDHHHGIAGAFVEVVEAQPRAIEPAAFKGIKGTVYHSTPSIKQFRPLPIPRKPTRSPRRRNSRSSARAAVSGSETVPMLPR